MDNERPPRASSDGGGAHRPSLFHRLTSALNGIGTVWIFFLIVIINSDVFGRAALNSPLKGVPEIVSLSIVGIVFLQLGHTLRMHRFIRSDVLIGRMLEQRPRLGHALQAIHHAVGAVLIAVIFAFTYPKFGLSWDIDEYIGTPGDFTVPVWPVKLIILVGCAVTSIQFLIHMLRDIAIAAGLRRPERAMLEPRIEL